jgi:subtilisin family serine protease
MTGGSLVSLARFAGRTGRGVRIAVVDSGIHATHPHVGGISGGVAIDADGKVAPDFDDRLGHGTAVAAAIREKATDAALIAVKVFDRTLGTTAHALAAAIEWSAAQDVALINLSLGTATPDHQVALERALQVAARHNAIIVSAAPQEGTHWLPGGLAGVVAVEADWTQARDIFAVRASGNGRLLIRASGYPRPIPGISTDRNFRGASFAVANTTGLLALAVEGQRVRSIDELVGCLVRSAD